MSSGFTERPSSETKVESAAGETAQELRAFAVLEEDLSLVPSTPISAGSQPPVIPDPEDPCLLLVSVDTCTHTHVTPTYMQLEVKEIFKK